MTTKTTLYKRAKKGKVTAWTVWVDHDKGTPVLFRESGFIDGKRTLKKKFFVKGNNIGKANEKTPFDLAVDEMNKAIKDSLEDNYVLNIEDIDKPPLYLKPALAKSYDPKKTTFPCIVQPKLNGCRAVSFRHLGDTVILSRQRNEFPGIDHISKAVPSFFDNDSPDGEIYKHGWTFQKIISFTKKFYDYDENPDYPESSSKELEYHVYDLAIPNTNSNHRQSILSNRFEYLDHDPCIVRVKTVIVNNHEEIKHWHDKWVVEGYEGIIVRDLSAEYTFNDRTHAIQKYKEFFDSEFVIVGHEVEPWDNDGVQRELIIWVCETPEGNRFNCRPVGSFTERERHAKNPTEHYGKMLTVRYQEKSEDGTPIFGTGRGFAESEGIRDYE